jgi:prepilin-type processing-associated H-X9-DG protein
LGWASGTRATLRNTGPSLNHVDPLIATTGGSSNPFGKWSGAPEYAAVEDLVTTGVWPAELTGGFSSWHTDGSNFLFCDGSVRLLNKSVDLRVYRLLGGRDDGGLISDDAY